MGFALLFELNWETRARARALSAILHDFNSRADWSHAIRIRYRLLLIRHQSANGRAGGKTTEGKPKFPAINGGGREGRPTGGCILVRGCTGNLPRNPVLAIRKARLVGRASRPVCLPARSCAKFCNRSTLPRHPPPPVPTDRSFSPDIPFSTIPPLPSLLLSTPPAEPTLAFSSFCARSLQPQPLHRSPLRLQLILLVLGRPFSNFEFLRWTRALSIGRGMRETREKWNDRSRDRQERRMRRVGVCILAVACARARARVRMASARFDAQKLIAYTHRLEDVSGRRHPERRERGAEVFSPGLPSGLHAGPETAFNVYIHIARELL